MANRSFRLTDALEDKLTRTAESQRRSKNWVVNEALRQYFENQDLEEQRWKETLDAIASIESGQAIAGEKVKAWLESWGSDRELPTPSRKPK